MAGTIPTKNPVPSKDIRDLGFNSEKIDEFVTSLQHEYKDRFGNCHTTASGMEWIFHQLVERFKLDMNQAIVTAGYIPLDGFQAGAQLTNNEITQRNQILRDESTGIFYRWDGDLPKKVTAGSTPQTAGGVGIGAWLSVDDPSLRSEVRTISSSFPQTVRSFSKERMIVKVVESNSSRGNGEIISYRKTSSGWWIKEKIVTGQYSGGASLPSKNCPAWRLGTLHIAPHILTIKHDVTNKTSNVGTYDFIPTQFKDGESKDAVKFHQLKTGSSQFIEFVTTTKEKEINILFAAVATTSPTMTVRIYTGSLLLSEEKINISTESIAPNFDFGIVSIKNPRAGSELKIRIVKDVAESYAYIAGINANFDNHVADDIDKVYTSTYTSKAVRTTQSGAMCYVFYEKGAGKFGGESHGGELPTSQKIIVDTKESTLKNGDVFSCESFRIVQETVIDYENGHKIDCFTEHKFNGDGTHEFTGSFVPTANFQAVYAYCPMFTVDFIHFKKIKTPEYHDITRYPEASNVTIDYPATSYEIQSGDGLFTAGIVWGTSLKNVDSSRVAIKPYPTDSSTKLYAGLSTGKTITLEKFTCHQLRYYY
ncbi:MULTISPECIES: hypothetical protein [Providencia]|uniref:Tail spike TSP1/Gp66 N-terminal domain-containing protein n=1 Tax=Providencia rettgeri TaxID=587 RepID=A0AAW6UC95_PRORE|nr:hypothetical protein [Providencia rettgeri]MDI9092597.1 hypothetical protein [Providencia rettgeri]MDT2034729.1 hypothetical protein [Providencia rettgeri]